MSFTPISTSWFANIYFILLVTLWKSSFLSVFPRCDQKYHKHSYWMPGKKVRLVNTRFVLIHLIQQVKFYPTSDSFSESKWPQQVNIIFKVNMLNNSRHPATETLLNMWKIAPPEILQKVARKMRKVYSNWEYFEVN